jgi:hypothetical protein
MNYIRHLNSFFERIASDKRIQPTHISLYMALFQFWNFNRFQNPISISRSEIMGVSKILAKATYHKVIKELHEFGYINYRPSYNPFRGSEVELVQWPDNFTDKQTINETSTGSNDDQDLNRYQTKNGTATVPLNEPSYKHINTINDKLAYDEDTSSNNSGVSTQAQDGNKKNTLGGRLVGRSFSEGQAKVQMPPSLEEVRRYFEEIKSTKLEAEKYFNYFQSNGWKVGGRAAMKDWRAAARNWILNAQKFKTQNGAHVLPKNKTYDEPL